MHTYSLCALRVLKNNQYRKAIMHLFVTLLKQRLKYVRMPVIRYNFYVDLCIILLATTVYGFAS